MALETPTSSSVSSSGGGSIRAAALGVIAFPWFVHAGVVGLSALSFHPLAGRGTALTLLALAIGGAVALGAWAARTPGPAVELRAAGLPARLANAVALAGALSFAWAFLASVLWPVVAYDALAYRLPAVASWLDAGRIAWVYTDDPVRNGYPLGQEAVAAVFAAATGSFRLSAAVSFPFVASGALALWVLAESCGVRRPFARAGAALFVLVPMVPLNAASGYVDAAFAGALVALLCFAACIDVRGDVDRVMLVATGLAAAHVLSLKGNGVVFACAVLGLVVLRGFLARTVPLRVLVPALIGLPGAFWFIRNIVVAKNPFWPVRMALGGRVVFPGVASLDDIIDVVHNTPPEIASAGRVGRVLRTWFELAGPASDFDERLSGMGVAWVLVALPAIVYFLLRASPGLSRARSRLGFVAAGVAVCFAIQPMNWWARYTLWLWAAGALAIVCLAEALSREGSPRALTALLAGVAVLSISEGLFASAHANGGATALARHGFGGSLRASDPRAPANARRWVDPSFWELALNEDRDVCRGFWKPATDDANLDGVFAQLAPRPRVHVVSDDTLPWPAVRRAYEAAGCGRLLLFSRSPVLAAASREPDLAVERIVAFDPLFLVRPRDAGAALSRVTP